MNRLCLAVAALDLIGRRVGRVGRDPCPDAARGRRRRRLFGIDRPGIEALTEFGEQVGMVFQIVDDILDVVATDEELGKPAGNDLVEGVYTLPVIRALAESEALRKLLGTPLERDEVDKARALVRRGGRCGRRRPPLRPRVEGGPGVGGRRRPGGGRPGGPGRPPDREHSGLRLTIEQGVASAAADVQGDV